MNINKINSFIKLCIGLILSNIAAIVLLSGLGVVVYTFFRMSLNAGYFSLGAVLIIISLLLAQERG